MKDNVLTPRNRRLMELVYLTLKIYDKPMTVAQIMEATPELGRYFTKAQVASRLKYLASKDWTVFCVEKPPSGPNAYFIPQWMGGSGYRSWTDWP